MKTKTWNIGDVVCDMHYGLPKKSWYPEDVPLETKDHIRIPVDGGTEVFMTLLSKVGVSRNVITNKMAVVVGDDGGWLVAAYSYDNRYFGMFKFCNKVS